LLPSVDHPCDHVLNWVTIFFSCGSNITFATVNGCFTLGTNDFEFYVRGPSYDSCVDQAYEAIKCFSVTYADILAFAKGCSSWTQDLENKFVSTWMKSDLMGINLNTDFVSSFEKLNLVLDKEECTSRTRVNPIRLSNMKV